MKPLTVIGPLDAWPIASYLLDLLPVRREIASRCFYAVREEAAIEKQVRDAIFSVPEKPPKRWARDVERAQLVHDAVTTLVEPGFDSRMKRRGWNPSTGFHTALSYDETIARLQKKFEVVTVDQLLASVQPEPEATTAKLVVASGRGWSRINHPYRKVTIDYLMRGGELPDFSGAHGTLSEEMERLMPEACERWNPIHERALDVWFATAPKRELAPHFRSKKRYRPAPGVDRRLLMSQKLEKRRNGSAAALLVASRMWDHPSVQVWVANQVWRRGRSFADEVLALPGRSDVVLAYLLGQTMRMLPSDLLANGIRDRFVKLCASGLPRLVIEDLADADPGAFRRFVGTAKRTRHR
jgi:hypothetical protein